MNGCEAYNIIPYRIQWYRLGLDSKGYKQTSPPNYITQDINSQTSYNDVLYFQDRYLHHLRTKKLEPPYVYDWRTFRRMYPVFPRDPYPFILYR